MVFLYSVLFSTAVFSQSFFGGGFSAKYEETTSISQTTGKKSVTVGKIDYQYPSHLRMEAISPHNVIVTINMTQYWHYQATIIPTEKSTVSIGKNGNFPVMKIFDSLYSGLSSTDIYSYSNDGKEISLFFKEQAKKDFKIEKIVLKSSKGTKNLNKLGQVEELVIFSSKSEFKIMKFLEYKDHVFFDKDYFIFKIPPNTKVSKD